MIRKFIDKYFGLPICLRFGHRLPNRKGYKWVCTRCGARLTAKQEKTYG